MLDPLMILANSIMVQMASMITSFLIVILTAVLVFIPLFADFALVFGALFFPLALAAWPYVQKYTMASLETMLTAAFQGVAAAVFLQIMLGDSGPIVAGMSAAAAKMQDGSGSGEFFPVLNALQGAVITCIISILIALKLPNIVAQIWGGGSLNGGAVALSAMRRAATAATGSAAGAVKGGMAAKASGGSVLGGALGGAARGATAGSQSARAISMATSGIPKAAPRQKP